MKAETFERVALESLDALYGYALRLARSPEDAEDLVQETYARAMRQAAKLQEPSAVRPTLFRILHNHFVDRWRAEKRGPTLVTTGALQEEADLDTLPVLSDPDNPRDRLLREAMPEEVEQALASLHETWREALWLREVEDYSYEEISRITETPVGTVRSRLARARRALVGNLKPYAQRLGIIRGGQSPQGREAS